MEYLKYFITEDIYLIKDDRRISTPQKSRDDFENTEKELKKEIKVKQAQLGVIVEPCSKQETDLLKAILGSLNLSDNNIVLVANRKEVDAEKLIIFEENPASAYQIIKEGSSQIIRSHLLVELLKDIDKKRKLWGSLKQMFGL